MDGEHRENYQLGDRLVIDGFLFECVEESGARGPSCPRGDRGVPGVRCQPGDKGRPGWPDLGIGEESSQSSTNGSHGDSSESGMETRLAVRPPLDGWDAVSLEAIRTVRMMMEAPDMETWQYHLRTIFNALVWLRSTGYFLAASRSTTDLENPAEREAFELEMVARAVDRQVARMDPDYPNLDFLGEKL